MYNDEYENEQDVKTNDNFIVNFYYNNKVLIWIFVGVIAFILIMSLLTRGGSSNSSKKQYTVSIFPESDVVISIGNSYPLRAKVDKNANAVIVWSSENEDIAKVDNGTVTAVNYGKTKISATYIHGDDTKYTATKEITVAEGNSNLQLTDVSFKSGSLFMPVNSTYDITLSLTPSNGYITNKTYTSSNTGVVTVDNKGHVVSVGEGEAIITLNVNNGAFVKTLKVYVNKIFTRSEIVVSPDKISFDGELIKMKIGVSQKLRYTLFPVDSDASKLEWISSDESIVTVDDNGYIKALKEGSATVTLKSITGVSDTINVEVETDIVPVTDINVALNDLYLTEGQVQTITPTVSPTNASNKSLSFMPSDTSVIAVAPNQTGTSATIYALSAGTTTITISSVNNVERIINVIVSKNGSGNSGGGSSGGSSSSSQGFSISSRDANNQGFIVTSYNGTINNVAVAPVTVTVSKTDSSIAKIRMAKCDATASSCDPSGSIGVTEFTDNHVFTITATGTYLLRFAKYNSSGTQIGSVDKYIAVKNPNANTTTCNIANCSTYSCKTSTCCKCSVCASGYETLNSGYSCTRKNTTATKTCNAPTELTVDKNGRVEWRLSSNCPTAEYELTVNNTNKKRFLSGSTTKLYYDYKSAITQSYGSRTISLKAISKDSNYKDSTAVTKTIKVWNLSAIKGTGVSSVSGSGNYIDGATATIKATSSSGAQIKWLRTGTSTVFKTTNSGSSVSVVMNDNLNITATSTGSSNGSSGSSNNNNNSSGKTTCVYEGQYEYSSYCNKVFVSKSALESYYLPLSFSGTQYGCVKNANGKYDRYKCTHTN